MRYKVQRTKFFVTKCHFLPFDLPNNPKNQNFEKMKQNTGDIIILHKCTINDNRLIYGSWDITTTDIIFFVILGHTLPFYPSNSWKNENFTKMKKEPGDIVFYTNVPKIMIICSAVPEIWHVTHVIFIFHFGLLFALLSPHNSPKNQNYKKWKKPSGDIIILQIYTKNYDLIMYGSWDRVCDGWTDRWTDRWTDLNILTCTLSKYNMKKTL